jgi:hypothetical protein
MACGGLLVVGSAACRDPAATTVVQASFDIDTLPGLSRDSEGRWHLRLNRSRLQTIQRIRGRVSYSGPARNSTVTPSETIDVEWTSSHTWVLGDSLVFIVRRACPDQPNVTCVYVINDGVYPRDTIVLTQFAGVEVPTVNAHSLSAADGEVNTIFAPVLSMLGDTVTVTGTAHFRDHDSIVRQVQIVLE